MHAWSNLKKKNKINTPLVSVPGASSFALASKNVSQSFSACFLNFSASSGIVAMKCCNAPVMSHGLSLSQWTH